MNPAHKAARIENGKRRAIKNYHRAKDALARIQNTDAAAFIPSGSEITKNQLTPTQVTTLAVERKKDAIKRAGLVLACREDTLFARLGSKVANEILKQP